MAAIENILLDRDGTIILDKHYLHDPEGVELFPDAGEALKQLAENGAQFFVLTNQSGIGRGYFTEDDFSLCTQRLAALLSFFGVKISSTEFCPHAPESGCNCRKPLVGMWQTLVDTFGIQADKSVMIGDKIADVELGLNAGLAASILVLTGKGIAQAKELGVPHEFSGEWYEMLQRREGQPHCVAKSLQGACEWILLRNAKEGGNE